MSPLPGVDREHLHKTLDAVREKVSNLNGGGPHDCYERLLAYLDWATDAVDRLDSLISSADLDRLVLTRRYEQLLAGLDNFTIGTTQRLVNQLINASFDSGLRRSRRPLKRLPRSFSGGNCVGCRSWLIPASTSTIRTSWKKPTSLSC
ncbi:hypothetical protein GCM10019016_030190 [Streptomyces prasinosporus]|uniref:Uncharacterized protein n=1 Tax=Streptomyces prasinosporus TaxID=68256 RepID=A0ABP6TL05_9ACTN